MGRRGPAREPNAQKIARGETRPSRLNHLEPRPREGTIRMPADMSDRAKTVWRTMLEAAPTGLITPYDQFLLRSFCEAVVLYRDAITLLSRSSQLVKGQTGNLVKNPLHQVVRDHRDAIRLLGRELGATPAGRAGMSIAIGGFLGGGGMDDIDSEIGAPGRLRVVGGSDE